MGRTIAMVGFMDFRDSNQGSQGSKYISKRVTINGQYVTLYSSNGQTWVSSPEDLPALMERLENARITLNTAEKVAEGEGSKAAKPDSKEKEGQEPKAKEQPEKILQTKYRVKGPKPRPILRQDGVVIKGTPIEPVSASSTVLSFSSDQVLEVEETESKSKKPVAKDSKPKKEVVSAKKLAVTEKTAKVVKASQPKTVKKSAKKEIAKPATRLVKPAATKPVSKSAKSAPKAPAKKAASSKKAPAKGKAKKK